jgi:hypothetical protein
VSDLIFYCQFTGSKLGIDDLSPTIDISSVRRSNAAIAAAVTAGSMTQLTSPNKRGLYLYRLSGADLTTFDYVAVGITSDSSVDLKEVPALWARFSEGDAQTGDSYAVVSNGTYGLSALKTLLDAIDDYVDTEITAIKAKTDNLPSDPADASDIAASFTSIASTLTTIAAYIDTEIAAILAAVDTEIAAVKTKTDQLTFTTTNKVDATVSGGGSGDDPLTNPVPGDYQDGTAGAALGKIGNGQITTVGPVAVGGEVRLKVGCDNSALDGQSLNWTDTNAQTAWPTLTGATIIFAIGDGALVVTGSVITGTGSPKAVRAEPTAAQTATLTPGKYDYDVVAVLASGRTVPLAEGRCIVRDRESS